MLIEAKTKLMAEFGWTEARAYHAIRIASSLTNRSMDEVSELVMTGHTLPSVAVRASEEIPVLRSKLESLRSMVRGRAANILDSILRGR